MKNIINHLKIFSTLKNKLFPFYKKKETSELMSILQNQNESKLNSAMFVGGCVRKHLRNETVDDIDIATIYSPKELKKIFLGSKYKLIETGLKHGSITLVREGKKFELTVLRKDIKTDGRFAEIEKIDDWVEDSKRRDFTINSIYMNRKGKIFDPQSGTKDLENGIIKFIGDPSKRIEEDYLRIIRYIRFSLQYEKNSDESTIKVVKLNLNGIKKISKERLFSELMKILNLGNFLEINNRSNLKEIINLVFPELLYLDRLKKIKMIPEYLKIDQEFLLAVLLIGEKNNHDYFCHKYNVTNHLRKEFAIIAKGFLNSYNNKSFFSTELKKNIYIFGKTRIIKILIIGFLNSKEKNIKNILITIDKIKKFNVPKFPYDGQYLKERGIKEGKKLGFVLKEMESKWISNDFKISEKEITFIINKKINY